MLSIWRVFEVNGGLDGCHELCLPCRRKRLRQCHSGRDRVSVRDLCPCLETCHQPYVHLVHSRADDMKGWAARGPVEVACFRTSSCCFAPNSVLEVAAREGRLAADTAPLYEVFQSYTRSPQQLQESLHPQLRFQMYIPQVKNSERIRCLLVESPKEQIGTIWNRTS